MTVSDALDAMRSELPGCSLVAFADLSSQIVLTSSSVTKPMREELDALSAAAHLALDGLVGQSASSLWATDDEALVDYAMVATASEARVFFRSPGKSSEALICVCAPASDFQAVVDCAQSTLKRIVEET